MSQKEKKSNSIVCFLTNRFTAAMNPSNTV